MNYVNRQIEEISMLRVNYVKLAQRTHNRNAKFDYRTNNLFHLKSQ
jgi:hypothetical protein